MVQVPKFLHESGSQTTVVSMVFCMSSSNKNIVYEKENKNGNKRYRKLEDVRDFKKPSTFRTSCSQIFLVISVLKNFATFTGKHLCWKTPEGQQLY